MIEGQDTLTKFTRLKYGMVGGGKGAFIGDVHRKAIAMDGKAELVAGCFSQSYKNTLETGESWGVAKDRLYKTYEEMIQAEAKRKDRLDFILIVTPNDTHFPDRQARPRKRAPRRLRQAADDEQPRRRGARPARRRKRVSCSASPTPIAAIRSSITCGT